MQKYLIKLFDKNKLLALSAFLKHNFFFTFFETIINNFIRALKQRKYYFFLFFYAYLF